MSERLVRYATLTGYPELAASLGLDAAALMRSVGLDLDEVGLQDKWVSGAAVARLLDMSARRSGCDDFGVRMARLRRFSALGPLGMVLREEPDLRSGLEFLSRYELPYNGVLDVRLVEEDRRARVELWLDFGAPVPLRQALDTSAATLVGAVRTMVDPQWTPLTACFSHPPPADRNLFGEVFGPALLFDHTFTGIVFPSRDLDLPTIGADPALRPYARRLLQSVAVRPASSSVEQVGTLLEALLPAGRGSMTHVSRALTVRPRTLHRRLAEEGQSFTEILHATRARLAERYLANDRYSLTDVSGMLGFTTPSAFSTWFRSRFGMTPTEWRTSVHASAPAGAAIEQRG